jgi:hypothetical protein
VEQYVCSKPAAVVTLFERPRRTIVRRALVCRRDSGKAMVYVRSLTDSATGAARHLAGNSYRLKDANNDKGTAVSRLASTGSKTRGKEPHAGLIEDSLLWCLCELVATSGVVRPHKRATRRARVRLR